MSELIQSKPLYEQIKTLIIQEIALGRWAAGERLPNEFQLGAEFGVSQGTVRKALDAIAREGLLMRQQGKGTYIAEHDQQHSLFKFFHLVSDQQQRELPESKVLSAKPGKANPQEQQILYDASRIMRIQRLRYLGGKPIIFETITVPSWLIRTRAEALALPNTAYWYYQRERGITVAHAEEKLRAVAAAEADAKYLAIAVATPLLEIERLAIDLRERCIEYRVSRCLTDHYYYLAK